MTEVQQKPEGYIGRVADFFDLLVPVANDDQLFASGYLRGHFDLAVGQLEVAGASFATTDIVHQVEQSLQQAIENGELSEADQQHVNTIWLQIRQLPA